MSNFAFLQAEWPDLYDAAARAEALAFPDPRTSCFYSRRALETAVTWLYRHDRALRAPYQDHLSALLHEPTFQQTLGPALFTKARVVKDLGNLAVHGRGAVRPEDACAAVRELFHLCFWLARSYTRGAGAPADNLRFNAALLPKNAPVPQNTQKQLQTLAAQLAERDARLTTAACDRDALDQELQRLRDEIASARRQSAARPDHHDYSEAQTRDLFIDLLLREAGWSLSQARDREFPVSGMPNPSGQGFVDYVLWGDDGKPLGLCEAKRTRRDPRDGKHQAELYADALERACGQRPVIFYSNGYEHWLWDDRAYPPRPVQGFLKKDELALLILRRSTRLPLTGAELSASIIDRFYQARAIRRIAETFEHERQRKALLVMATGAGKTRTVIALCDLMLRRNWVKRVLFLADRRALVKQAVGAFKQHLPAAAPVNLVTERSGEGRVYAATYQTMMGLVDQQGEGGGRRFGVGHFDLIIVDEAHRSVYQKYRALFDYFDALLVGLTATPREEIDRNTYSLFALETGVPTDSYDLPEAVKDGFLVPPHAVSVPLRVQREGLTYDQLSEEDKERWDALEWDEDGEVPERVEAAAVNKWLFNRDTVDQVLQHLMTHGQKVAGGDRLGKTIIFAKNRAHADFIAARFDANYPRLQGRFAQVIAHGDSYAQDLIDSFSIPDQSPHIAISIDMLDTGIDVPEVVNLVFFKLVRSSTKFRQMLGRGTRLCKDLFGPGQHKTHFLLFDFCENLEFFRQTPQTSDGALAAPLGQRLFNARLELLSALDGAAHKGEDPPGTSPAAEARPGYGAAARGDTAAALRGETAALLQGQVAAMNLDNFLVRPRRRAVERYAQPAAWQALAAEDYAVLSAEVSGLPSELPDDEEGAKRFDLLLLGLQLAVLRLEPGFARLRDKVIAIAGLLEEKMTIPMVNQQLPLILEVQTDEFWQDVTPALLEGVRKRLRALVKFIDKAQQRPVYSDFADQLGPGEVIELPGLGLCEPERFRAKARLFLRAHEDHVALQKVRRNRPLTATDLAELERMLLQVGTAEQLAQVQRPEQGLGLFIRSLVGLEREAAKAAFGAFLADRAATADQIEFINLIVEHLTEHGAMDTRALYESPFTDNHPRGPEGLFSASQLDGLVAALQEVRRHATG